MATKKSAAKSARATRATSRAAKSKAAKAEAKAAAAAGADEQLPGDGRTTVLAGDPNAKADAAQTRQLESVQNRPGPQVRDPDAIRARLNEDRQAEADKNVRAMEEKRRRAERDAKEAQARAKSEQEAQAAAFSKRQKAEAELEQTTSEAARVQQQLRELNAKIEALSAATDRPKPNLRHFEITARQLDPAKVQKRRDAALRAMPRLMIDPMNPNGPLIPAVAPLHLTEPVGKSYTVIPYGPSAEKSLPIITVNNAADESDAKAAYCLHLKLPGETLYARVEPADVSDPAVA